MLHDRQKRRYLELTGEVVETNFDFCTLLGKRKPPRFIMTDRLKNNISLSKSFASSTGRGAYP